MSDWVSRGIFFVLIGQFVTQMFGVVRRMSAREAQGVASREQRFRALVHRAADMIAILDPDGTITYESPAVERILGWEPGQRLDQPANTFVHPDDRERAATAIADVLADPNTSRTLELRQQDSAGAWHWVESTVTNLLDEPTVRGIVVNDRVVDERKALEHELTERATYDTLTGLANRALLRERIESALVRRDCSVRRPGLLFIDIDDFKTVNDGFGHGAGDRLLIEFAGRLRACVRPEDLVARLGGDEFAVLIEEGTAPRRAATDAAQRILDALNAPFDVSGYQTHISASVGIASYRGGIPDPDLILRQADMAMYKAKANGKAQHATFSTEMDQVVQHRLDVEAGLRTAVEHDQIRVLYQPIVSMTTGQIDAVEALLRWEHPTRGLLSPIDFLDVAEETGLIVPIGRIVLDQACQQAQRWREGPKPNFKVGVNFSAAQLKVASIVDDVRDALARAHITGDALIVEVTEGALIADVARAANPPSATRARGQHRRRRLRDRLLVALTPSTLPRRRHQSRQIIRRRHLSRYRRSRTCPSRDRPRRRVLPQSRRRRHRTPRPRHRTPPPRLYLRPRLPIRTPRHRRHHQRAPQQPTHHLPPNRTRHHHALTRTSHSRRRNARCFAWGIALKATRNSDAIATMLRPLVRRVVLLNAHDSGDRGGDSEDRQDRRPDPRPVARGGLLARDPGRR
jgi:diguanylate cyclase (GGDEF)-like protein/PAS domain S-box-containing protein